MTTKASSGILSTRALNRALLSRQMMLAREKATVVSTVERIAGMQAQLPRPPFIGLWTRIRNFQRQDLQKSLHAKTVIRATAMRGTIHLLSRKDFIAWRPVMAEMLVRGAESIAGKKVSVDRESLYATGREFFGRGPAPFEDFRAHLEQHHSSDVVRALAYTVRMGVPLVMVPSDDPWGFSSNAGFTLADNWLGETLPTASGPLDNMVLRYLAAFGPATPGDFQTWSGIRGARETFDRLRPRLTTFRDERKRELFDLPKAPRPDDVDAPVRFLPEFDNALLAHDDRSRIIDAEHRKFVFLKNLQVLGTFLIDGRVAGIWKAIRKKKTADIALTPFGKLRKADRDALAEEGEQLARFVEPDAAEHTVSMAK